MTTRQFEVGDRVTYHDPLGQNPAMAGIVTGVIGLGHRVSVTCFPPMPDGSGQPWDAGLTYSAETDVRNLKLVERG